MIFISKIDFFGAFFIVGKENGCCLGGNCRSGGSATGALPHTFCFAGMTQLFN